MDAQNITKCKYAKIKKFFLIEYLNVFLTKSAHK